MSIDAAPRERYAPVRRARATAPAEDEAAEPARDEPAPEKPVLAPPREWLRRRLSWREAVFALEMIFGSAYVKTEYFPGKHERARRREVERIERMNSDRAAREKATADRLVDDTLAHSMIAACEQLAAVRTRPDACRTPQATQELHAAADRALEGMAADGAADLEARCAAAATELEAARTRLGCR